jgi:hypothetical protein
MQRGNERERLRRGPSDRGAGLGRDEQGLLFGEPVLAGWAARGPLALPRCGEKLVEREVPTVEVGMSTGYCLVSVST